MNKFCLEQKWKINKNPLVWKRVPNSSGSCHLIGGINEFFDHLIEYYNVDTRLDKRIKKQIALDNEERLPFMLTEQKPVYRPVARNVCITGAAYPSTCYLVSELLQLKQLQAEGGGGVSISLHHKNSNNYGDLIRIKNEICDAEFNVRGCSIVTVVNSVEEGLLNCDLLIVIGSMKRGENEDQAIWTNRNFIAMKSLASILNRHCPERCKVLLMSMDLLCFNLSVLAENAEKVYLYNIVGVTGHHGMVTLPTISRVTSIPIPDLHCPPVWGFDGSAQYIDFNHVIYHCGRSGVDLGKPDNYDCEDAATVVHNYSADRNKHKYLQNVLMQSESLQTGGDGKHGVVNTTIGTFGLPFGTFISQPVCMENGEWKPNFDFPSPDETIIIDIVSKVADIAFNYDLGKRFNVHYPTRESRTNIFDE